MQTRWFKLYRSEEIGVDRVDVEELYQQFKRRYEHEKALETLADSEIVKETRRQVLESLAALALTNMSEKNGL